MTDKPHKNQIHVVDYDTNWGVLFEQVAVPIREAMRDTAQRIDHIGSTAVEGLAAKPVIDIQISVTKFEPFDLIQSPLVELGYRWGQNNPDLTKRYFREAQDNPQRIHIHVRLAGSWSEQQALLFRDYLRANPQDAQRYENVKRRLATQYVNERNKYVEGKSDIVWDILRKANAWTQVTGWQAAPSDI